MIDTVASSLACRAVATACLAYVGCATTAGMGVDRDGAVGGRAKIPVVAVVSVTCQAVACLACVAFGIVAGVDIANTTGGGGKEPVASTASAARRA